MPSSRDAAVAPHHAEKVGGVANGSENTGGRPREQRRCNPPGEDVARGSRHEIARRGDAANGGWRHLFAHAHLLMRARTRSGRRHSNLGLGPKRRGCTSLANKRSGGPERPSLAHSGPLQRQCGPFRGKRGESRAGVGRSCPNLVDEIGAKFVEVGAAFLESIPNLVNCWSGSVQIRSSWSQVSQSSWAEVVEDKGGAASTRIAVRACLVAEGKFGKGPRVRAQRPLSLRPGANFVPPGRPRATVPCAHARPTLR